MRLPRLEELFACRLCWRITLTVFALILAVESVLLVPSAQRFERGLLKQLADEAIIAIEPTLAAAAYGAQPRVLAEGIAKSVGRYGILGVLVATAGGGRLAAAGETDGLERQLSIAAPMGEGGTRSGDGTRIDVAWPSANGLSVAARVDTGRVAGEVLAYLLRIGGLVGIIVLVVTAGTMLVLHRAVLRPMLRLRQSSLNAGRDPDRAEEFRVRTRRSDEIGELIGAHNAMLVQIADSKRRDREIAEERVRYLARHHPLTGLPNRDALIEHVDGVAGQARGPGHCVSLLLLKIRQFRALNASIGARRCDQLLRQVAARLRHAVPAGDLVAHLGANRFAAVHDGESCGVADVAEIAERLLREIGFGYDLEGAGSMTSIKLRIGIGRSEGRSPDGRTLLNEAELALARAAETEGAKYLFHSPELSEQVRERQVLARDLESALASNQLFIVAQPKMALRPQGGAALSGAEVLVRWKHPTRGMVRPDVFIALAESNGLIAPIGDFVLRAAARAVRGWLDRYGWAPPLAVNLSALQFTDPALVTWLQGALQEARIPASALELEITETAAMKDAARSAATLEALRAIGVKVSIDDFGTGYSSLNYLRRFAVDAIKIDKSFVDDIGQDANADAVCDAILRLGQSLGTRVIAEGVETERQLAFLRQRRCDEVQGYFFGKPVPLEEFETTWVAARAAA